MFCRNKMAFFTGLTQLLCFLFVSYVSEKKDAGGNLLRVNKIQLKSG